MTRRTHKHARPDEGFTLIELLVVMVIIGILAAIAVPSFLRQRDKGYQAAEKEDLKHYAIALESYGTDYGATYTPSLAAAMAEGYVRSSDVTIAANIYNVAPGVNNAYCLQATHTKSTVSWYLDSVVGSVVKGTGPNCTTTVTP